MWMARGDSRDILGGVMLLGSVCLAACGDTCVAVFSNNGNGGGIIRVGSPPPVCSFRQATGIMNATAEKAAVCETCAKAARAEHLFVTVRGVELNTSAVADENSADWVQVAPELEKEPRQIDLMDGKAAKVLSENALVPAGTYRRASVRLAEDAGDPAEENVCGKAGRNCVVMGDGRVESLRLDGEAVELRIEGGEIVVLPESKNEMRVSLDPVSGLASAAEGFAIRSGLAGRVSVERQE